MNYCYLLAITIFGGTDLIPEIILKDRQGEPEGKSDHFLNEVAWLKRLVVAWTPWRGLPPLTDEALTMKVRALVVSLPRLVCGLWRTKALAVFGYSPEEAGPISITFSRRT